MSDTKDTSKKEKKVEVNESELQTILTEFKSLREKVELADKREEEHKKEVDALRAMVNEVADPNRLNRFNNKTKKYQPDPRVRFIGDLLVISWKNVKDIARFDSNGKYIVEQETEVTMVDKDGAEVVKTFNILDFESACKYVPTLFVKENIDIDDQGNSTRNIVCDVPGFGQKVFNVIFVN